MMTKLSGMVFRIRLAFQNNIFLRNVLTLITGSAFAQAIPVLLSPIISRLYTVEQFAVYTLIISVVSFLTPIATAAYENAIVLPKEDDEAKIILWLTFFITIVFSGISLIIFIFFGGTIARILGNTDAQPWLILVPIILFFTGIYQSLSFWYTRKLKYKTLSNNRVLQSIIMGVTNIGFSFPIFQSSGLILGKFFSQLAGTLHISLKYPEVFLIKTNFSNIKHIARKYSEFPKFTLIQNILDGLRESGLIFLISNFFGSSVLGAYGFALRVLRTPMVIIGASIYQVYYQHVSEAFQNGQSIRRDLLKITIQLTLVGIVILFPIAIAGPQIFSFLFNSKWWMAGRYSQILAPWLFMNLITSPISSIPFLLKKQRSFLIWGIGYDLLLPACIILAPLYHLTIENTFLLLSFTGTIYLILVMFWIEKISRKADSMI